MPSLFSLKKGKTMKVTEENRVEEYIINFKCRFNNEGYA